MNLILEEKKEVVVIPVSGIELRLENGLPADEISKAIFPFIEAQLNPVETEEELDNIINDYEG